MLNKSKRNLIYVEVLRTFSLLGVMVFHVMTMLGSRLPETSETFSLSLLMKGSGYYVNLSVAMFMFISGYLYRKPNGKVEVISFLKKKLLRLWLPYCTISLLIMLTSGFFNVWGIFRGDFWHLWFLTALFWCFMVSIAVDYSSKWMCCGVLLASLIVSLVKIPPILGLRDFSQWYYFFALGAIVRHHPSILKLIEKYHLWIVCLLFYIIIKVYVPFSYRTPSIVHNCAETAILLSIWLLFSRLKFDWGGKYFFP